MSRPRNGGRRRPAALVLLVGLTAASLLLPTSQTGVAGAADPVRVMPLGDSITEGREGTATYRYFLWKHIEAAGRSADFVGSRTGARGTPKYPDFDQDHEGHAGWRADELVTGRGTDAGRLADWLTGERPDIVLLHIGTNDLRQCQSVESTAEDVRTILTTIRQHRPGATTLLARIIPTTASDPRCSEQVPGRVGELNDRISALARSMTTSSSPIVVVDQHSGFDVVADTSDRIHPDEGGEQKMAERWYAALGPLLPPVAPPTTAPPTTAPPTTAPPTTAPAGDDGYWMLGATGVVHPFGAAGHCGDLQGRTAVDLEPFPDRRGYWILDGGGTVTSFACAGASSSVARGGSFGALLAAGERPVSLSATPDGTGYWVFTDRGRALRAGSAPALPDLAGVRLNAPVLDSVATRSGKGCWLVAADGGIFALGDATFSGSMGGTPLNAPVLALAPDPDRGGYWLVAADGGVFAFDAPFLGSMGGTRLNAPMSGIVASATGRGYLLVARDGGGFAYGDVAFRGSLGGSPPGYPIIDAAVR